MKRRISVVWQIEDVLGVAPDLSQEEASKALELAERYHDASIGINWDVLRFCADEIRSLRG